MLHKIFIYFNTSKKINFKIQLQHEIKIFPNNFFILLIQILKINKLESNLNCFSYLKNNNLKKYI